MPNKLSSPGLAHAHDNGHGLSPKAIAEGAKIEMEHTADIATAKQIAIDHLRERPDYYTRLKRYVEGEKSSSYKLQGETNFNGLDIAIENKKGSRRYWHDANGKETGSTLMHHDYGYIRCTEGTDGDHVDVYVGPDSTAKTVFIVNQMKKPAGDIKKDNKPWTEFDEQKCMLGFASAEDAKAAYMKQYNDPRFFGSMKVMPFDEFKMKVLDKTNHGKKVAGIKEACGDAIQYFRDPMKLKEKQMRDRSKTAGQATQLRGLRQLMHEAKVPVHEVPLEAMPPGGVAYYAPKIIAKPLEFLKGVAKQDPNYAKIPEARFLDHITPGAVHMPAQGHAAGDPAVLAHEFGHAVAEQKHPYVSRAELAGRVLVGNRVMAPTVGFAAGAATGDESSRTRELATPAAVALGSVAPLVSMEGQAWHHGAKAFRGVGGNMPGYHAMNAANLVGQAAPVAVRGLVGYELGRTARTVVDKVRRSNTTPPAEATKTAVSAAWIRERAVSGLAKRNVHLDPKEQAAIARKAIKMPDWLLRHAIGSAVGTVGTLAQVPANYSREKERKQVTDFKRKVMRGRADPVDVPESQSHGWRSVLTPVAGALSGAGTGAVLSNLFFEGGHMPTIAGGLVGAGLGALAGHTREKNFNARMEKRRNEIRGMEFPKAAALSPAALSALQHSGIGAGIGAVAGGLGGMAHAAPDQRLQGFGRGALVGGALGAAGGAGVSAIKNHGVQQLASLRSQAQEAEHAAVAGHQHVKNLETSLFSGHPSPATPAAAAKVPTPAPRAVDPLAATQAQLMMIPEAHGFKQTASAYQTGNGMLQDSSGRVFRNAAPEAAAAAHAAAPAAEAASRAAPSLSQNLDVARQQASAAGSRAAALGNAANTLGQQQQVMNRAINHSALAGAAAGTGLMGYMAVPQQYGGVGAQPQKTAASFLVSPETAAFFQAADAHHLPEKELHAAVDNTPIARNQAWADRIQGGFIGGTLGLAAGSLPGAGANHAPLMLGGMAAGGLIGALAGGHLLRRSGTNRMHARASELQRAFYPSGTESTLTPTQVSKVSSDDRTSRIADRLDDAGIGLLAAPYIADAAAGGLKHVMLRGGRLGALAAEGHTIAEGLAHQLHQSKARELAGLALVAPGVTHPMAKAVNSMLPPQPPAPPPDAVKMAQEAGRVLANEKYVAKTGGLGRLALGLGAVGGVGLGLYAGKKTVDAAYNMTAPHGAVPFAGSPPGMRPPVPAGVY